MQFASVELMQRINIAAPRFEYDGDDPEGFRSGMARLERLEPWDVVFFPKGPEGAHGIGNETEETVRVLMFSTVVVPTPQPSIPTVTRSGSGPVTPRPT